MLGSLVSLALLVWVPQLLAAARDEAPPPRPEVGNEDAAAFAGPIGTGVSVAGPVSHPAPLDPGSPGDLVGALEETLAAVEDIAGAGGRVDLDELVAAFHAESATPVEGPLEGGDSDLRAPAADTLDAVLGTTVLRGVVHDGRDPVAMLGDRIVRVGQVLPDGVQVVHIGRREVWVEQGGRRAVLELPPFVPRAASPGTDGEAGSQAEAGGEEEGGGGAPPPAPGGALDAGPSGSAGAAPESGDD
jgi:hypothetical protein